MGIINKVGKKLIKRFRFPYKINVYTQGLVLKNKQIKVVKSKKNITIIFSMLDANLIYMVILYYIRC